MIRTIKRLKTFCLYTAIIVVMGSNIVNYFYCHLVLDDRILQWKVAMIAISLSLFLMAFYMWLNETLKGRKMKIILTGWLALYLLFNLIGVAAGYNLHTKGFVAILFITTFFGAVHLGIRLWQRLF